MHLVNPFMPYGFSHLYQLDESISNLGLFGGIFHFYSNFDRTFCKETVENLIAASDPVLHCLPMSHKKDTRLIWVKSVH